MKINETAVAKVTTDSPKVGDSRKSKNLVMKKRKTKVKTKSDVPTTADIINS